MRQKLHLIIYMVAALVVLSGCGAEQAMKKGDKFYALGEYYDAVCMLFARVMVVSLPIV